MGEQNYQCPNPACGKVFSKPLKAENKTLKERHSYNACPFCLTEIVIGACVTAGGHESGSGLKTAEVGGSRTPKPPSEEIQHTTSAACTHELGYLSKRSSKEGIPEECMMCGNIVQCMLKNIAE